MLGLDKFVYLAYKYPSEICSGDYSTFPHIEAHTTHSTTVLWISLCCSLPSAQTEPFSDTRCQCFLCSSSLTNINTAHTDMTVEVIWRLWGGRDGARPRLKDRGCVKMWRNGGPISRGLLWGCRRLRSAKRMWTLKRAGSYCFCLYSVLAVSHWESSECLICLPSPPLSPPLQ